VIIIIIITKEDSAEDK